ncbi:MAG: type 4a pilus biogenesis protein PilO [Patescibacteria group bacterium]|nr:type 4a pilus biogenesis protein PilO [Patescibacteria group bacterium]
MRLLLPIILIIAAVGLFALYTNPTYQNIQTLQGQYAQYNSALTQSSQVRAMRDQLLARRNTFSSDDVNKLQLLLPDSVDDIRLIIDINDIAARYHLQVQNVALNTGQQGNSQNVGSGSGPVGSVELTFSVSADYNDFVAFLEDLERSLRLIDVEDIKFDSTAASVSTTGAPVTTYTLTIQTYWLR